MASEMKVDDYVVIGKSIGKILKINNKIWCLIGFEDEEDEQNFGHEVWYSYNSINFYSSDKDVCKAFLSAKKYNL